MSDDLHKPIYDLTPFTLIDYPDKTACIIWFAGCNMQCVYCYNPDIVYGKGTQSCDDVLTFLNTRKGMLDGVVLSGGECTRFKDIKDFVRKIKDLGFEVKIDTNGGNPKILEHLIQQKLLDYIALDFKAPKSKFFEITASKLYHNFLKSLELLLNHDIPFEIRTTFHNNIMTKEDLEQMITFLRNKGYHKKLYVQPFKNNVETIGKIENSDSFQMNNIFKELEPYISVR